MGHFGSFVGEQVGSREGITLASCFVSDQSTLAAKPFDYELIGARRKLVAPVVVLLVEALVHLVELEAAPPCESQGLSWRFGCVSCSWFAFSYFVFSFLIINYKK